MLTRSKLALATTALLVAGCGQESVPEAPMPAPETAAPAPETAAPAPAPAVMRKASPPGAQVYIIEPADGATVSSPVTVKFGLRGAGVAPAGIDLPNTGHHHLLIDTQLTNFDQPIPADANHLHYGLGQTEATIELSPGRHELQLVLGDHLHIPHEPPLVSDVVTIDVRP
jgi:hypothetical protein